MGYYLLIPPRMRDDQAEFQPPEPLRTSWIDEDLEPLIEGSHIPGQHAEHDVCQTVARTNVALYIAVPL